jgi:HEAT repeat protein
MNPIFRRVYLFIFLCVLVGCGPDRDDIRGWYKDYENDKISKSQAIEQINDALKSRNYDTHSSAAFYLGRLGDRRAYKPLLEIMKNSGECSDRWEAIRALGNLGDPRAIEHLLPLLEGPVVAVSGNTSRNCYLNDYAIEALGDIKDPRAVEPLIKVLNKKGVSMRLTIVALGKIGDVRAADPLIEILEKRPASIDYIKYAAWALGEIKDPRAIDPLIEYLIDVTRKIKNEWRMPQNKKNKFIRGQQEAVEALRKLGSLAIEPIISSILKPMDRGVKTDISEIMLRLFGDPAIDILIVKLKHVDPQIRSYAAEVLGMTEHPRAIDPLIEALNDENKKVRAKVRRALYSIGEPSVNPLIETLNNEANNFKEEIIAALGSVGKPSAVDALISIAKNQSSDLRLDAIQAMCRINSTKAKKYIYDEVVKRGDLKIIAGIYGYLISMGKENSVDALIKALHKYGDKEMATYYLISGNVNLQVAASEWATKHGKDISTTIIKGSAGTWGWGR